MIPLYGFVAGDTLAVVVLVAGDERVAGLAAKLQQAAAVRVRPRPVVDVVYQGRTLDPRLLVAEVGLRPLDRVDLVVAGARPNGKESDSEDRREGDVPEGGDPR